jgi:protein-tyrosine phosphatase
MELDRWVPFTTVFNFRDLGGYATSDGRAVRPGRLYRSDGLYRLAPDERDRFGALSVRTVVDLRRADELAKAGQLAAAPGLTYHHVSLQRAAWTSVSVDAAGMARYLADQYANIAEEGAGDGTPVGRVLRLIAEADNAPLVFHCAAGKDRTGVVAALTLSLLGVPDAVIAEDYALTQRSEDRYNAWRAANDPAFVPPTAPSAAPAAAMHLFLTELRTRYGSVPGYAARAGVTPDHVDALRAHLLH